MEYPAKVREKAQQMEQLLLLIEQGTSLEEACAQLNVEVSERQLSRLQAKYQAGGRQWEALQDGRYGHRQGVTLEIENWLYARKRQEAGLPAKEQSTAAQLGQASSKFVKSGITGSGETGGNTSSQRQLELT